MIKASGLGLVDAVLCPHYNKEEYGGEYVREHLSKTPGKTIALDDCCAIEIIDDEYRIISSDDSAGAYLVYWKNGEYLQDVIPKTEGYSSLSNLLQGD
jgi:hypothetical protein